MTTTQGRILTAVGLILLLCASLFFFSRNTSENEPPCREAADVSITHEDRTRSQASPEEFEAAKEDVQRRVQELLASRKRTPSPGEVPATEGLAHFRLTGNRYLQTEVLQAYLTLPEGLSPEEMEIHLMTQLHALYRSLGFVECSFDLSITPGDPPVVDLEILEGNPHHFGELSFEGVTAFDSAELESLLPASGELADFVSLKRGYEELKSMYRDRGYLDAQVVPNVSPDYESKLTGIMLEVTEGPRYHVGNLSMPSDWPAILQSGEPFHLGLLRAFLESRGLSLDNVVMTPHPESATVDISVSG